MVLNVICPERVPGDHDHGVRSAEVAFDPWRFKVSFPTRKDFFFFDLFL